MTLTFLTGLRRGRGIDHCLVGYDPVSERAVFAFKIPRTKAPLLREFVQFEEDDPEGYDSYALPIGRALKLLEMFGQPEPVSKLDYFIEAATDATHRHL
jgi:hypothetical protein